MAIHMGDNEQKSEGVTETSDGGGMPQAFHRSLAAPAVCSLPTFLAPQRP